MDKKSVFRPVYLTLVLLLLYLPMLVVILYSFNANTSRFTYDFTGFSWVHYEELFTDRRGLLNSLATSIRLALYSCGLSIILGTLGAVGMARTKSRIAGALEGLSMLPIMVPEIILGMAFMAVFNIISLPREVLGIPRDMIKLVIAHTTFCVPYIFVVVKGRLVGMDPSLVEAARDLGAGPVRAFMSVTLPLIVPGILSGALLAFAMSMDDFVISFFVSDTTNTLPLNIYSSVKTGVPLKVNALSTLMLAASAMLVAIVQLIGSKRRSNG